jgi:cell division protein FtsL
MRTLLKISFPLLVVLMLAAIYSVKYETWQLRREAHRLENQIAEEKRAIAILRADWAYLSRPERIERLARQYLKMAPAKPSQIVELDN